MDEIIKRFDRLERLIESQSINNKEVLDFNEACHYLKLSQSHLYKLTSSGAICHYKPNGKKIYFKRSEIDAWLLRNRIDSKEEADQKAIEYLVNKGRVRL